MMNMPTLLKLKVKTKLFAKAVIGNSLFQFLLIILILLPFAYLNLKGWYELLYVIFGFILLFTFLVLHEGEVAGVYAGIAFILFIIAVVYYVYVAMPSPFGSLNPPPITNPLINFFIFFSFDFMLASFIFYLISNNDLPAESYGSKDLKTQAEDEIHKLIKKGMSKGLTEEDKNWLKFWKDIKEVHERKEDDDE